MQCVVIEAGQLVAEGSLNDIYRLLAIKRIVHVQVAGELRPLAVGLRQVKGIAQVEEQTDRLAIHVHEDELPIEDLHQELVRLGARIRMFQPEAMDMETAFMTLAADMAEEVDRKSARLLSALEPALIVIMFAVIGSLLMAILLPILSASSGIRR